MPEVKDLESTADSSSEEENTDAVSTAPMISAKSISENEIKESASGRLRQDLPSGTYDRFGRPTLKPVFSDINASLRQATVKTSSTSLLSAADKRRSSLNLSIRQKRPSKSFLPMDSFPVQTNPAALKIRSVTTQTTDNASQNQPALTSETLFAFDIHEMKKKSNSSEESRKSISEKSSQKSEKAKRPRSSGNNDSIEFQSVTSNFSEYFNSNSKILCDDGFNFFGQENRKLFGG